MSVQYFQMNILFTKNLIYFVIKYLIQTYQGRMRVSITILVLIILIYQGQAYLGVDVSQLFSVENYTCMKNGGITFAVARSYCSFGGLDQHAIQSLTNIKASGIPNVDMYMFPCRGKNATAQVNQMVAGIPRHLYGMVWVDVETNPSPGCSYSGHDSASNCQFLNEVVSALKAKSINVGIYASRYMWGSIFGAFDACKSLGAHPLWYAHYDNTPSFADFTAFGGWTKPTVKQYLGTTSLCGASVDRNYYP